MPSFRSTRFGWLGQCGERFLAFWPAKMMATMLGMTAFFFVYFWLLQHPLSTPAVMPLTVIDRLIGFWPGALPLYLSLWLYVSLVPALIADRRELLSYGVAALVLSAAGLGIFFLWPTAVPHLDVDWARHPSVGFLKSVDASGNACPSLHVAFAVFSGIEFARVLREIDAGSLVRGLNWFWCVGILYSTVALRQHVALDVLAGAVLGALVAGLHLRWLRTASG